MIRSFSYLGVLYSFLLCVYYYGIVKKSIYVLNVVFYVFGVCFNCLSFSIYMFVYATAPVPRFLLYMSPCNFIDFLTLYNIYA